jgi:PAS domain S-box-containing protein
VKDGRTVAIVGSLTDITERKRAEDALRESEQRFALFMLHMPAAAWMKDLQGRFVYANAQTERTFSMPLTGLQGKTDWDFFPPEIARQFAENDRRVLSEGGSLQTIEVLRQADGVEHYSLVSKFVVSNPDGKPAYIAGVAFDITEHRRLEEERDRLAAIVESSDVAIFATTLEGVIVDWNRGAEKLYGYTAAEIKGLHVSTLAPADRSGEVARNLEKIGRAEFVDHFETVRMAKGGRRIPISLSISPIRDTFGRITGASAIAHDISARKEAEKKIEELNTNLAERAGELALANQELETFNYSVAHDLRKPLTVVSGYCQVVKEMCGNQLDGHCKEYLQQVYNGTLRMNRLIDALLNFSHLGHVELRREMVDLSDMAQMVAAEQKLAEPSRPAEFRIAAGVRAYGDANLLRVVLDNLLGNAWKYTGKRELAVIEFGVTGIDGEPVWFVRDNGEGFDMADAAKLFIPFQRLPGAAEFKGFGIGLATVERIIRRHGGKIWAEGEPGKGSTFYFTLAADDSNLIPGKGETV